MTLSAILSEGPNPNHVQWKSLSVIPLDKGDGVPYVWKAETNILKD